MILPTKHIPENRSLLAVGAIVLRALTGGQTVTRLWDIVRSNPDMMTFQRFVLALDLLYAFGLVELRHGEIKRATE